MVNCDCVITWIRNITIWSTSILLNHCCRRRKSGDCFWPPHTLEMLSPSLVYCRHKFLKGGLKGLKISMGGAEIFEGLESPSASHLPTPLLYILLRFILTFNEIFKGFEQNLPLNSGLSWQCKMS